MRPPSSKLVVVLVAAAVAAASAAVVAPAFTRSQARVGRHARGQGRRIAAGIHKIRHVIVIMQENRSFDSYFGTFPGADGILRRDGIPTVCVPDPQFGGCVRPYHDASDRNAGGAHGVADAVADVDGGLMDGSWRMRSVPARAAAMRRTPSVRSRARST